MSASHPWSEFDLVEDPNMMMLVPHPMSSERTLAKVAGGRWFPKLIQRPSKQLIRYDNPRTRRPTIVGHPATIAELKQRLRGQP